MLHGAWRQSVAGSAVITVRSAAAQMAWLQGCLVLGMFAVAVVTGSVPVCSWVRRNQTSRDISLPKRQRGVQGELWGGGAQLSTALGARLARDPSAPGRLVALLSPPRSFPRQDLVTQDFTPRGRGPAGPFHHGIWGCPWQESTPGSPSCSTPWCRALSSAPPDCPRASARLLGK